jgi:hypothetical protein
MQAIVNEYPPVNDASVSYESLISSCFCSVSSTIGFIFSQQCPSYPGIVIGQRHCCDIGMTPRQQLRNPGIARRLTGLLPRT